MMCAERHGEADRPGLPARPARAAGLHGGADAWLGWDAWVTPPWGRDQGTPTPMVEIGEVARNEGERDRRPERDSEMRWSRVLASIRRSWPLDPDLNPATGGRPPARIGGLYPARKTRYRTRTTGDRTMKQTTNARNAPRSTPPAFDADWVLVLDFGVAPASPNGLSKPELSRSSGFVAMP